MRGTEARHRNAAVVASTIAAVRKINSVKTVGMDTAARLTGGVDLAAVSMPIVAALLIFPTAAIPLATAAASR